MKLGLTLALIACLFASFGSAAGNDKRDDRNQGAKNEQRRLAVNSPDQAVAMAQRQFKGKVLSVQSSGAGYRVKILNNDGQVFSVSVDAATGRVSRN
ncbi:PepSY domain-containing protein [Shewanella glacialipiscicola]|uniref:Peptidase M4 n=1 Tax=Shewanella glacialipiscicola TaxID=614069 RepID=A0ABQ6J8D2_9GAMM|nr:PepSY domain-containing protein [Shewanella glacialipiscicola]MCL1085429.1 PepSY domain-containing protein [Shewanella glacialipiscicola]MCU7994258.1 PepSY domain-containing protein [Shewanella glacialipiscicola]MCU8025729.1 PepSY domain-containing protein [Shewanella glacialipiscicola]GIU03892.1 peptidase M4 [Shewanella glacialipiscicola]GMA83821.1 peptidase M4 [Shewanella glacialipiscicola]